MTTDSRSRRGSLESADPRSGSSRSSVRRERRLTEDVPRSWVVVVVFDGGPVPKDRINECAKHIAVRDETRELRVGELAFVTNVHHSVGHEVKRLTDPSSPALGRTRY